MKSKVCDFPMQKNIVLSSYGLRIQALPWPMPYEVKSVWLSNAKKYNPIFIGTKMPGTPLANISMKSEVCDFPMQENIVLSSYGLRIQALPWPMPYEVKSVWLSNAREYCPIFIWTKRSVTPMANALWSQKCVTFQCKRILPYLHMD